MKKLLTLVVAAMLTLCACFTLTGCKKGEKVVKDGAKIIVGVTDYAPMDYLENGEWVGFDADLAKAVFTSLGYTVEFKEIDWDTKIVTLKAGTIDCIWNGMTVTDQLLDNLLLSNVYLKNQQVAVMKTANASSYNTTTDLAGKTVAVESGSAAEDAVTPLGCDEIRKLNNQNAAILDVFSGQSDVAIVDFALAKSQTAPGTSYYGSLVWKPIGFTAEEFAIAFRKSDSKLCFNVNKTITALYESGVIDDIAARYGVEGQLVD